jgi:hypothetical protein
MTIPTNFTPEGVLAPGTYDATFAEIRKSILVVGDGSSSTWNAAWRNKLLDNAEILVRQLWKVGVVDVFLDGSFVEDKDHPNDIDGYFDPHLSMLNPTDMVKYQKIVSDLNNLDPHKIWDWNPQSRRAVKGFAKLQLPMWIIYRVELFPHLNQGTGIKDAQGNDLMFPSAFRQSRHNFKPKGIVRVIEKRGHHDKN